MSEVKIFKTEYQKERAKRDWAIYNEYKAMMSVAGQRSTLVTQHLMKKYGVHSQGTIYVIRRRVEEMLKKQEEVL